MHLLLPDQQDGREAVDVLAGALALLALMELQAARLVEAGVTFVSANVFRSAVPVPAAYGLGHAALFAATELTTEDDMDLLVGALRDVLAAQLEVAHD